MTKITYRFDPSDELVPQPGRPLRSETIQENFQVLGVAASLFAFDTVVNVDVDTDTGDNLMTRSGSTVTVVTERDHDFQVTDTIIVSGADGLTTEYNGEFTINAVLDTTTFTYDIGVLTPPSPATGTIVVRLKNKVGVTGGVYYVSGVDNDARFFTTNFTSELDTTVDGSAVGGVGGDTMIVLLTIDDSGTLSFTKGDWNAGTPTFPGSPEVPICLISVDFDIVEISDDLLTDVRPLIRI